MEYLYKSDMLFDNFYSPALLLALSDRTVHVVINILRRKIKMVDLACEHYAEIRILSNKKHSGLS